MRRTDSDRYKGEQQFTAISARSPRAVQGVSAPVAVEFRRKNLKISRAWELGFFQPPQCAHS